MKVLEQIGNFICNKKIRFNYLTELGLYNCLDDEKYLKKKFKIYMGKNLDLNNPSTYNEKLQWLKINDHNPEYIVMVDKYEVKQYVKNLIGEEYIIPTLGVWDKFEDIDFNILPNKFVLKCTHDSGGLVICTNKETLNKKAAKEKIQKCLKRNYYWSGREWPYKDVPKKIIAEKYITDAGEDNNENSVELKDYKFYCFNGEVKLCGIYSDRNSNCSTKADYFDRNFNYVDLTWGYDHSRNKISKPEMYEEMIHIAEILAKDIPHVRVDLYCSGKRIYFGELTFYDGSGFDKIEPIDWDYKLGSYINLT